MKGERIAETTTHRLGGFDLARGIAALLVVMHHFYLGKGRFGGGFVAVELFFCLSGWVLAMSCGDAVRSGLGFGRLLLKRLRRLYPTYFIASVVSLVAVLAVGSKVIPTNQEAVISFVKMVFLIPAKGAIPAYPLNNSAWSLPVEIALTLVLFLGSYLSSFSLAFLSLLALLVTFASRVLLAPYFGPTGTGVHMGYVRGIAFFLMGMFLYQTRASPLYRVFNYIGPLAAVVLTYALVTGAQFFGIKGSFYPVASLCVPLTVVWVSRMELKGSIRSLADFLGGASYPLYILHWPFLVVLEAYGAGPLLTYTMLGLLVVGCYFMATQFEPWVRRKLA